MPCPDLCPAPNLTVPVLLHRTRDADTPEVRIRGGAFVWAIRLKDCWVPELHSRDPQLKALSHRAWKTANKLLEQSDSLHAYFELPDGEHIDLTDFNILKIPTFDRLPGWLFYSPYSTINRTLVELGYASTRKDRPLGT